MARHRGSDGARGGHDCPATAQARPTTDDLIKAVKGARLYDLSFVWNEQSPVLSDAKAYVSMLVLTPLRVQGATGSPLRAIAIAP